MDEVQIDVNDLMAAFARENASLAQRAVIAEQKAGAYKAALDRAHEVINSQREQLLTAADDPGPEPGDDAVQAVKPTRKRAVTAARG